ncbi:hypothetical protein GCM10007383_32120 [Arenibacter certesii]|uniref:Putative auto-transporter adhesin head GIN domain-containing protein n=1 Tax=Arenibacter certesii TaxID=228955 RepID=A0A918J6F8_9FLAO|nr:hypothetical protein GCM10007383_32120 [Arenibacter certesii]
MTASQEVTPRTYSLSGFTAVEVSDNFNVTIVFSDIEEKVVVTANDNLHKYIGLTLVGERLHIKLNHINKIKGKETLNVMISAKNITDFRASGNSKLLLKNSLYAQKLKIDLVGNVWFSGNLTTNFLDLKAKGNCMVELTGTTKNMSATLSGNSELTDYGLAVEVLKIDLSGNSNSYLSVSKTIDIKGRGNSMLFYKGDATIVHQDLSTGAKIEKKG